MNSLESKVAIANTLRDFCKHAGFKILMDHVQSKINDSRNEWLRAETAVKAEELRLQAKPWTEIEALLKKLIIEGDQAFKQLENQVPHDL